MTEVCLRSLLLFNADVHFKVRLRVVRDSLRWAEPLCQELGMECIAQEWQEPHDVGLTRGFQESESPLFLTLDSDVCFTGHGLLREMVDALLSNRQVFAVGTEGKHDTYLLQEKDKIFATDRPVRVVPRCPVHLLLMRRTKKLKRAVAAIGFSIAQANGIPEGKYWDTGGLLFDVLGIDGSKYLRIADEGRTYHFQAVSWMDWRYEDLIDVLCPILDSLREKNTQFHIPEERRQIFF